MDLFRKVVENVFNEIDLKSKYFLMEIGLSPSDFSLKEYDELERDKVISLIKNDGFEINAVENFIKSLLKSKRMGYLTIYSVDEYLKDATTYKLKGYDIGYAIKKDGDIISVFNNSGIPNLSDYLIASAKKKWWN
jgi:hypothetical protein